MQIYQNTVKSKIGECGEGSVERGEINRIKKLLGIVENMVTLQFRREC